MAILSAIALAVVVYDNDRIADARRVKGALLKQAFAAKGLSYPPSIVHLRGFKSERQLEVWVGAGKRMKLFKTYPIAAMSGTLGPKKQRGDLQAPEGFYYVDRYNPKSQFLLSLGLNYPNAADRRRSSGLDPGGDIFIHGSCVSIGCLAMTNDLIQEIFLIAYDAKKKPVKVEMFPMRMEGPLYRMAFSIAPTDWQELWLELERAYRTFKQKNQLE
ncbi:MAG: murein L,D-transpeptidase family protein [Fimbriimonas sp.]